LLYASGGLLLLGWDTGGRSFLLRCRHAQRPAVAYAIRALAAIRQDASSGFVRVYQAVVLGLRIFALENSREPDGGTGPIVLCGVFHGEAAVGLYAAASKITSFGRPRKQLHRRDVPYMSRLYRESESAFRRSAKSRLKYWWPSPCRHRPSLQFCRPVIWILYGEAYGRGRAVLPS